MTQKTKLEIIGEYRKDHPGPFCTRDGLPVEILTKKDRRGYVLGYQAESKELTAWCENGQFDKTRMSNTAYDLMCAREVHVAREFWVNEYEGTKNDTTWFNVFLDQSTAKRHKADAFIRTIHVREVLPGEGA